MLEIFDEIESGLDCELIQKVFEKVKLKFSLPDNVRVELTIVAEEDIQNTNREFRNVDSVTDVLSFPALEVKLPFNADDYPYDVDLSTGELMLGEIMLCYKRALEQSEQYGHSKERECCYLVLHGLLHLLGFDHIEESDRAQMRKQEEEILTSLNILRD
ncbi:MAG: rRNA maturation RNase YbeY [Clostridia bacterium]|nr:rRNA maturation RNase YbeY [Clostridia bacterium]MDE7329330.1 rRNA maturation RNase YbeY [Clostridia bacterium]